MTTTTLELTYGVYQLNRLAECGEPDSNDSPGARLLTYVQDRVNELDAEGLADDDQVSEIADGSPDIYTHKMWAEFVDLAAYQEDPTELGAEASNLDQCARVCLYMIAERLARVLVAERVEAAE